MSLEPVENHEEAGTGLLLSAWRERPLFVSLLRSYLTQVQELEDAIWSAIVRQGLDEIFTGSGVADGVSLDALGRVVGENRAGKTDEEYIPFIRAKVKANNSDGHVEQLIEILRLILPEDKHPFIRVRNFGHMEASVFLDDTPETFATIEALSRFLLLAVDAVVRITLSFGVAPSGILPYFSMSGTYGVAEFDEDTGFGSEYDSAVGGAFIHERDLF